MRILPQVYLVSGVDAELLKVLAQWVLAILNRGFPKIGDPDADPEIRYP